MRSSLLTIVLAGLTAFCFVSVQQHKQDRLIRHGPLPLSNVTASAEEVLDSEIPLFPRQSPNVAYQFAQKTEDLAHDLTEKTCFVGLNTMQTIIVTLAIDEDDGDLSPDDISLLEALDIANSVASLDTILFDETIHGSTIDLLPNLGSLPITDAVMLDGSDASMIVSGDGQVGVFEILNTDDVTIRGLQITDGYADLGGGIYASNSQVLVDDVFFFANTGFHPQGGAGGGICSFNSDVEVVDCAFLNNSSNLYGGATAMFGGSMFIDNSDFHFNFSLVAGGAYGQQGTVVIQSSAFLDNASYDSGGGALVQLQGTLLNIYDSEFRDNTTLLAGAGIGYGAFSMGEIRRTLITGNRTTANNGTFGGGGLFLLGALADVINCTFSDNHTNWNGGGIAFWFSSFGAPMNIVNCTFAENSAELGGGIYAPPETYLYNCIVATNAATQKPDVDGTFNSSSTGNVIGILDVAGEPGLSGSGNVFGTVAAPLNPKIGPLANNGGPTRTHKLLRRSPAIDQGDSTFVNQFGLETDQRGFERVLDGDGNGSKIVDSGAYEKPGLTTVADPT